MNRSPCRCFHHIKYCPLGSRNSLSAGDDSGIRNGTPPGSCWRANSFLCRCSVAYPVRDRGFLLLVCRLCCFRAGLAFKNISRTVLYHSGCGAACITVSTTCQCPLGTGVEPASVKNYIGITCLLGTVRRANPSPLICNKSGNSNMYMASYRHFVALRPGS